MKLKDMAHNAPKNSPWWVGIHTTSTGVAVTFAESPAGYLQIRPGWSSFSRTSLIELGEALLVVAKDVPFTKGRS